MPLRDLLYRCPRCGHDPVEGDGDEVRCPSCRCSYRRGESGARIRMTIPGEREKETPASRLTEAIGTLGGPLPAATDGGGRVRYEARATVRRSKGEEPVRHRGRVLGFAERLGPGKPGRLRVTDDALELSVDGSTRSRWNLLDLRAIQASSSSLQIYSAAGELVQFRFADDSPYRWEQLLHAVLRRAYAEAGRGEILEFQPRISTR